MRDTQVPAVAAKSTSANTPVRARGQSSPATPTIPAEAVGRDSNSSDTPAPAWVEYLAELTTACLALVCVILALVAAYLVVTMP